MVCLGVVSEVIGRVLSVHNVISIYAYRLMPGFGGPFGIYGTLKSIWRHFKSPDPLVGLVSCLSTLMQVEYRNRSFWWQFVLSRAGFETS